MSDLRPALDLPHRHYVDAVLVVADGKADHLCGQRRQFTTYPLIQRGLPGVDDRHFSRCLHGNQCSYYAKSPMFLAGISEQVFTAERYNKNVTTLLNSPRLSGD